MNSDISKPEFLGVAYDVFNSQVKAKIYRDLIAFQNWCQTRRIKLVVVCPDEQINFILDNLGITRVNDPAMSCAWLVYQTEETPEYVPEDSEQIVINMRQPMPIGNNVDIGPHMNPTTPKEQGRDATSMHLIDRPNPNPYAPTSPSGIAILFGC